MSRMIKCPGCKGRKFRGNGTCRICKGKGNVLTCGMCDGSGLTPDSTYAGVSVCRICSGSGLADRDAANFVLRGARAVPA
jgi:RecJ-like exonuclease